MFQVGFDLELKSEFFSIELLPSGSIITIRVGKYDWDVDIQVTILENNFRMELLKNLSPPPLAQYGKPCHWNKAHH